MIVTVTANPALDLTWHVASLTLGGVHRADAGRARAGGKGLNVARIAHAQGAAVVAVTTTGGEAGVEFAAELEASGVPHLLVRVAASTRRSIALVDEAEGDTTIVNEHGVAPTAGEWAALKNAVAAVLSDAAAGGVQRADAGAPGVLVISGSFPPGTPDDLLPALIGIGRDAGATVIADTSGPALLVAADAGASVLKPNEHELRDATGLDDPVDGARELLRRGAELVLLSLGKNGMLAVSAAGADPADATDAGSRPDAGIPSELAPPAAVTSTAVTQPAVHVLHARLESPLAGNPTGAGDAGVAACAVLMDAGIRDPERILRRATAWSAAAVLMPLAGDIHPTWPDLEAALTVTAGPPASSHFPHERPVHP
jgi:1-phosphofructokinase family hexose kinase